MPLKVQSVPKSRGSKARSKVFEQVVKDLRERDQAGFAQFGIAIEERPMNAIQEAYEEALDLCVYLRMALNKQ